MINEFYDAFEFISPYCKFRCTNMTFDYAKSCARKIRWMQYGDAERRRGNQRRRAELFWKGKKKRSAEWRKAKNERTIGNNKIWSRQDDKVTMLLSPVGGSPSSSSAKAHRLKVNRVQRALSKQRTIATPATQPESRALYEILLSSFASRPSANPLCSSPPASMRSLFLLLFCLLQATEFAARPVPFATSSSNFFLSSFSMLHPFWKLARVRKCACIRSIGPRSSFVGVCENGNTIVSRHWHDDVREILATIHERYRVASSIILSPFFFREFVKCRTSLAAAHRDKRRNE